MSLQLVTIIGNATKDAEQKVSKDGVTYVSFRIAASSADDRATFYNVIIFGHYGEVMKKHITKGREIFVSGRLEISEKGYVSVITDHIQLLRFPKSKARPAPEKKTPKNQRK